MPVQIQTGIPLIYEAVSSTVSDPMPVGSLHGLTIGAHSASWEGSEVELFSGPIHSTNIEEDYAPVLFYDQTPVIFTENASVPVLKIKPGSYLIARLSVSGSPSPITVYIG